MALNPPLSSLGEPYRVEGEIFILQRGGIEFEVKVEGLGKMKGKGIVSLMYSLICYIDGADNIKNCSD